MGNQRHHRVLSTSTCDLEECLRPYAMCNIYILYYVYWWSLVPNLMQLSEYKYKLEFALGKIQSRRSGCALVLFLATRYFPCRIQ
jgi:hypothetical protein